MQLNTIHLTHPTPLNYPIAEIGRRISLLRNKFHDKTFPLNSLLSSDFEFEKETQWGSSFTREEIVTNIRQFQEFLNKNNMVY